MFAFIKLNEKIESKDFELLPIDEINEDDMLTPKEFQKTVNAAIQLDTQKPVIDDNGGEYSNESNDNMTARAFWRDSDTKSK